VKTTFGVIVGNRGFFPAILARDGREEILRVLDASGYCAICLTPDQTKFGAIETMADAQRCAELFKLHRDEIDGILVALPNFGDERGVANAIRMSGVDVPVLVQAFPDDPDKMLLGGRRDSFCGKISVTNNLWQYGIRFTLTRRHTVSPSSHSFRADLTSFAATCRVMNGLRRVRVGVIGARPAAFNTGERDQRF
jgi:L-fucose isomerase-like protein